MSDDSDFYGECDDESSVDGKNWERLTTNIKKDGYRAGIAAGEEESLQTAFNETFSLSSRLLFNLAQLRGKAGALMTLNFLKMSTLSKDEESRLLALIGDIVSLETQLLSIPQCPVTILKQRLENIDVRSENLSDFDRQEGKVEDDLSDSNQMCDTDEISLNRCSVSPSVATKPEKDLPNNKGALLHRTMPHTAGINKDSDTEKRAGINETDKDSDTCTAIQSHQYHSLDVLQGKDSDTCTAIQSHQYDSLDFLQGRFIQIQLLVNDICNRSDER